MRTKDVGNDQSAGASHLAELHGHLKAIREHLDSIHELMGLESGTTASGSSGSGANSGIKSYADPEITLATVRQQLRQAQE